MEARNYYLSSYPSEMLWALNESFENKSLEEGDTAIYAGQFVVRIVSSEDRWGEESDFSLAKKTEVKEHTFSGNRKYPN